MHRPNIIVDIDNTLADTQGAFLEYIAKISGRTIPEGSIKTELRGDGFEWYEPFAKEFIVSTRYEDTVLTVKPYPTSLEAMKILNTLGDIHIVSSRINNWHDATHAWLEKHGLSSEVESIHLRDVSENSVDFKRRILMELKADYLFDDSTDIALGLRDIVDMVYLIAQPWNEKFNLASEDKIEYHQDLPSAARALSERLSEHMYYKSK